MRASSTVRAMTTPSGQDAPQPPEGPRRGLITAGIAGGIIAALVLMAATGAAVWYFTRPDSAAAPASAAVTGTPAAAAPARSPLQTDPIGQRVCPVIASMYKAADIYDPDKLEQLGDLARTSADTTLSHRGGLLAASARLARASKGKQSEFRDSLAMAGSATELATLCTQNGYA